MWIFQEEQRDLAFQCATDMVKGDRVREGAVSVLLVGNGYKWRQLTWIVCVMKGRKRWGWKGNQNRIREVYMWDAEAEEWVQG